jgi:hypothetical protein
MHRNHIVGYLFPQEVILDGYMFGLGVKDRILWHTNCIGIITMNWDRCNIFYLQVCKCLNHPKYLGTTSGSCNVFIFYS